MRVAIIGGSIFDNDKLEDFLHKLAEKYPDVKIVTGSGKGAERKVADYGRAIGLKVEVPDTRPDLYASPLDCQVNDVMIGADVYVIVGGGSRPTLAMTWYKRCVGFLPQDRTQWRPIHTICPPAPKAKPAAKAKKKQESLAA